MTAQLLEPYDLAGVRLRNRVFVSAHTTNFGKGNLPTRRHVDYHRARARGGVGLIITEALRVHPTAAARDESIGVFDDACIDPLAQVADAVHAEGGALFGQVLHIGRQANGGLARTAHFGVSPIPWATGAPVPHVMDRSEIRALVDSFGSGARRALAAGLDGLEVHLGHGHLLAQFLSPASNHRTDDFGGDRRRRMRVPRAVLERVLAVADGRPVGIRISAEEFLPDGLTSSGEGAEDVLEVVRALLQDLPLAFVNVSHSAYVGQYSLATQIADMTFGTAHFRSLPARVKAAFPDTPVMAICRMDTIETAQAVLDAGDADLVGLTRAHIADPDLVAKASGRADLPVRHCIACNQGCIGRIEQNLPMSCVVNPEVGFEGEWQRWRASTPVPAPRRVLVVGAGPTGLEAAVSAAARGHQVTLRDAASEPGGQIRRAAAALAGRDRFDLLVADQLAHARALGVRVEAGRAVTAEEVLADPPDAVVVATGSQPRTPPAGTDVWAAVSAPDALGAVVAVVDEDGTWAGAGTALHLARQGREVHLVTPVAGLAWNVTTYSRLSLTRLLGEAGVTVRPLRRIAAVEPDRLVLADVLTGAREDVPGVTGVVDVGPRVARADLADALLAGGFAGDVVVAGDAYAPRTALEAVYEGRLAGVLAGGERPPTLTDEGLPPYVRTAAQAADDERSTAWA